MIWLDIIQLILFSIIGLWLGTFFGLLFLIDIGILSFNQRNIDILWILAGGKPDGQQFLDDLEKIEAKEIRNG